MRLLHPESEKVQQGAIFNCVSVRGFEDAPCFGIVITARCDLEHGKQSVVNYLPIIPFSAWAKSHLCYLLAKTLRNDLRNSILKALRSKSVSEQVLETFPLQEIVLREVAAGNEQQKLLGQGANLESAEKMLAAGRRPSPESSSIIKSASKAAGKITSDLITQKLPEYYFVEHLDVFSQPMTEGGVVLLRQMQTMESSTMRLVARGIQETDQTIYDGLTFRHEPICMFTGVLRSPDIEHLGQTFSHLFTRIGLADPTEETINWHLERAQNI